MDTSKTSRDDLESRRRKPDAKGVATPLADGSEWRLAIPSTRADRPSLTDPEVDDVWSSLHESLLLDGGVSLRETWTVARRLLLKNYDLSDEELGDLLEVTPGEEASRLVEAVLSSLFGERHPAPSYVDWVRASLLAAGLATSEISARDLPAVLSILVATNRPVAPDRFIAADLDAQERATRDSLV